MSLDNIFRNIYDYVQNQKLDRASENFNPVGVYSISAHGSFGKIYDKNGKEIKERGLDNIANKAKMSGNTVIWLISCYANYNMFWYGSARKRTNAAGYLAEKSGLPVLATSKYVVFGGAVTEPFILDGSSWDYVLQ